MSTKNFTKKELEYMSLDTFRGMLDERPIKYFLQYLVKKRSRNEHLNILVGLENRINEKQLNLFLETAEKITEKDTHWYENDASTTILDYFKEETYKELGRDESLVIDLFLLFTTHFAVHLQDSKKMRKEMGIKKGIFS